MLAEEYICTSGRKYDDLKKFGRDIQCKQPLFILNGVLICPLCDFPPNVQTEDLQEQRGETESL